MRLRASPVSQGLGTRHHSKGDTYEEVMIEMANSKITIGR